MSNEEWIAGVQYGDLAGTAAADGHTSAIGELRTYLTGQGVDMSDFEPIGLKIWNGESHFSFGILCKDQTGKVTSFRFEKEQDLDELRKILKRLEVILLREDLNPQSLDWSQSLNPIYIDDRPQ